MVAAQSKEGRGIVGLRRLAVGVCAVGALALAPSPAGAAVTIGETFTPTGGLQCQNDSWFQGVSPAPPAVQYSAPSAGVITSWSFEAAATAPTLLRFKVFRPTSDPEMFQVVGRSVHEHPHASATNTFETRLPVELGDLIGLYAEGSAVPCQRAQAGYFLRFQIGDDPLGTTTNYVGGQSAGPWADVQLDVSAQLEPDSDNDGFGDETQDACPDDQAVQAGACPPDPDTAAPQTALNRKPKKKSTRRKATFAFSSEAGVTFKCSRDGKPFSVCTSPLSFRAKLGRHSFVVFAKDAAGNVDDSPATASWTVRPRR
jgi:hypothetical protein